MLTLQFKNEHIYFCIEQIWDTLQFDYKFKAQLNNLCTANPDNEYVQTIAVPVPILLQLFNVVTVQPEGVAASINANMLQTLIAQIQPLANFQAVQDSITARSTWLANAHENWLDTVYNPWLAQHPPVEGVTYEDEPAEPTEYPDCPQIIPFNEAAQVLLNVDAIDKQNKAVRDQKILNGKTKILA